jgi:GNAT acetyltransferase-like protein
VRRRSEPGRGRRVWILAGVIQITSPAPPISKTSTLRTLPITLGDPRWEPFVARHPEGSIYHHPAWVEVLEQEQRRGAICFACVDDRDQLRGILPLAPTKGFPFARSARRAGRWSSLPRTPLAGPLALDGEAMVALASAALERVQGERYTNLELRMASASAELGTLGLAAEPWLLSYILQLPPQPGQVRFGNSRNHARVKWALNKAARLGVQVRQAETVEDLRRWYPLYLEVMRRHTAPPRPFRFFEAAWNILTPRGLMRLLLAERWAAGRPELLAGSIFLAFGVSVIYAFNGCRPAGMAMRANDVIQWQAIHDASRAGFRRYDMGEVVDEEEGLHEFKKKWGAEPHRMYRYYYPAAAPVHRSDPGPGNRAGRTAKALWRTLPLGVTAAVGNWLFRFV